jgi:hypothetical protein
VSMPPSPRGAGAPAAAPMARAAGAFPAVGFIDRAMSQLRETVRPVCSRGSDSARSRGEAGPAHDDRGCVEGAESWKQTSPIPQPIEEGVRDLVRQLREFLVALWLSPGRHSLALLIISIVLVICATAAAQVGLNAWNRPFYEAIAEKNSRRSWTSCSFSQSLPAAFSSSM